ncbi:MAG: NAD(P)H-dependent glycerol-3-phosphate dehydrogenase [bacterium]|nr:NAD(P)H-dependent glycerol-3-phosphate dehydrogenase [bacterium]
MAKIGVIGAGAWGLTIAKACAQNKNDVTVWAYMQDDADAINNEHKVARLPNVSLPINVVATTSLTTAVKDQDGIIIALASDHVGLCKDIAPHFNADTPVLVLTKGLLENCGHIFVSEYIIEALKPNHFAVLSGPNIAIEIAQEKLAATVIAGTDMQTAEWFQARINRPYFRPYTATDIKGVEFGGVLKNAIALAAGICDALDLGTNAKSALITRGLSEMTQIATLWGAKKDTLVGLSGLGDLITTCMSPNSRNNSFGRQLTSTDAVQKALRENTNTTEGVKTVRIVANTIPESQLEIPIFRAIARVLDGKVDPRQAISGLMSRHLKAEQ